MRELWPLRRGGRPSTSCLYGAMAVSQRSARSYPVRSVFAHSERGGALSGATKSQLPRSNGYAIDGAYRVSEKQESESRRVAGQDEGNVQPVQSANISGARRFSGFDLHGLRVDGSERKRG